MTVKGIRVGVPICEDVWLEESEEYENVVECLAANRRSSVVVVDDEKRPLGRILADDLIDALASDRGRPRFPRVVE